MSKGALLLFSTLEKGTVSAMRFHAATAVSLAAAALLVSAAPSAFAQNKAAAASITQTITLKHRKPSEIVALLAYTSTSTTPAKAARYTRVKLTANDTKNTLTARGGKQEVALLRTLAASLDVAPQVVRLRVRLLRQVSAIGEPEPPEAVEISRAAVKTNSATPVDVTLFGDGQAFQVNLTPRVLRDGTVAVEYHLGVRSSSATVQDENTLSGARNLRIEETPLLVRANILSRYDSATPGGGTSYYIEITPVK